MTRSKRPDWDAARRQERAGPRTGNAGGPLVHVRPASRRQLRPVVLETRGVGGVDVSLGCTDPLTFYVRFSDGDWLPIGVLGDALRACRPAGRRVPPQRPATHFSWWVEERKRGHFTFEWRRRDFRGTVELSVVEAVVRLWDEEWEYAFLEHLEEAVKVEKRLTPDLYRAAARAVRAADSG